MVTARLPRLVAVLALASSGFSAAPVVAAAAATTAVIVEAHNTAAAARAVEAVGGTVDRSLDVVSAVAAHVSNDALQLLHTTADVIVVPDATMHPTGLSFDASAVDNDVAAMHPGADWGPDAGAGVGVALIDTGVADTPGLTGRLVRSPDFSDETDGLDHYGHGTFMAGLIAGDGTGSSGSLHTGSAPGATVVSVKVAGADGTTTLSRVIAGIGWAISHADTYNIGVMNLSFGVDDVMPYIVNPLSAAVEAAWSSGITVVASAGNDGSDGVTSPGSDPYVITVGASATNGTTSTADDAMTSWTGRQDYRLYSKPDVVAPGVSVVSLRAPGSTIDIAHPEGRVDANYFRGSGTSMSTALVAGSAAILLSHHPDATPDDIKGALLAGADTLADGSHAVNIDAADNAPASPDWWQFYPVAFEGLGRGLKNGMGWTATRWSATRWSATRWSATRWSATRWSATRWSATRWSDAEWAATRWSATRWSATRWSATRWSADSWPSEGWG